MTPEQISEVRNELLGAGMPPAYLVLVDENTESLIVKSGNDENLDLGFAISTKAFADGYARKHYLACLPRLIELVDKGALLRG